MITFAGHMRLRSPVFLLAASFWGPVLEASAQDRILSPEYEQALHLYARGERRAAVAALSRLRPDQIEAQLDTLENAARRAVRCASCPNPVRELPLKAAVMLHVDRDQADREAAAAPDPPRVCPGDHTRRAGRIAVLIAQLEHNNDFVRRFFLAMAQRCQWYGCLEDAQQWGRDGLKLFPHDPALLSNVAAALEEEATLWAPKQSAFRESHLRALDARREALQERAVRWGEAERLLSQALVADPTMNEARVRLGRVQWRLGKDEMARQTLEEALRRFGAPPSPYLAHLCLGQVHRRAGRSAEAIQEFNQALALDPQSQAAAVALSEALLFAGDATRAREILQQAMAHAGRRSAPDAHWRYTAANTAHVEELFEELRGDTRE
jgi:tetratricopeptide (TPR) repeat protein